MRRGITRYARGLQEKIVRTVQKQKRALTEDEDDDNNAPNIL